MGWTDSLSKRCLIFSVIFFAVCYLVFQGNVYSYVWIIAALFILIFIITFIRDISANWMALEDKEFKKRLFLYSLFFRLFTMAVLLIISYNTSGWQMFYYVGARDPQKYFRVAWEASIIWSNNNLSDAYNYIFESYSRDISDTGFSTFLTIPIQWLNFGPVMLKVLLCVIGSISVLRGYKLATLLFEKEEARLGSFFLMVYPISWFYSSVLLKESLMVLLITEALLLIAKLQKAITILDLVKVLTIIVLMFFFRSAISILLIIVLLISLFMQYRNRNLVINIIISLIVLLIYIKFLRSTGRYEEYYQQYTDTKEFSESRLTYMESINPFVAVAGTPVFAALALISPFPSVVKVPIDGGLSHNEYYYHVAGNLFWIILAFFSFYGIYHIIRFKRAETAPIWTFVLGYQFILLKAMMFTSVRFSYPAKPFLLILAAYGIYQMKSKKWYPLYLFGMLIMIIGWNYVRLKGRS